MPVDLNEIEKAPIMTTNGVIIDEYYKSPFNILGMIQGALIQLQTLLFANFQTIMMVGETLCTIMATRQY